MPLSTKTNGFFPSKVISAHTIRDSGKELLETTFGFKTNLFEQSIKNWF